MSILLEFAMFPTNKGESVSKYVSRIIKMIDASGVSYKLTPMGTIMETETMEEALEVVQLAYNQLEPDCNRVYASLNFDIRKGETNRMTRKIRSIEDEIGAIEL